MTNVHILFPFNVIFSKDMNRDRSVKNRIGMGFFRTVHLFCNVTRSVNNYAEKPIESLERFILSNA